MQRAKLFAYVNNNIQITWKMIYICKVYSAGQTVPSTAQIMTSKKLRLPQCIMGDDLHI
jgi:hypothetical protein